LVNEAATLWNLKTLLRDRLHRFPTPCLPLCLKCPLSSHQGEGVVGSEVFTALGSLITFDIPGGIGLDIDDCIVTISGTRYVPHFIFIASEDHYSCIVCLAGGNWNHINNDTVSLVADSVRIKDLIKECRNAVIFCIESTLLNQVSASQIFFFSDPNGNSSCFLNCIVQWLKSLKHLYRPKKLDRTTDHGRLWHLFRCCLWENDKQKVNAYTYDINILMATPSIAKAGIIGNDFYHLLDIIMSNAKSDFDLIPWEVSKSSVRCCCSSLIDTLGSQQLNVLSVKAPLKLDQITTDVQLPEPTPEKPLVPVSAALQAALKESEVHEISNVKLVIDHVQVPTDIPKGMCLTLDDETSNSSKAEKELLQNGFSVLNHQFYFDENHVQEFISVFDKARKKIRPIRNTLGDLDAGDDWNIPGNDAPRSMMYETDMPKHMELKVIQQVKNALRDEPSLQWLTKNRPFAAYTLIRSKSGTPHQFWHRDYCLKYKKNKRMSARKVPLFIIVAIQRQTSLDFPTGKIYIPLGRIFFFLN
jgi:hypothetical protein